MAEEIIEQPVVADLLSLKSNSKKKVILGTIAH